MTDIRRPALKYHGGKWRVAHWVLEHMPPHHAYVEPFGGAGSVLLRKLRSPIEVYNDLDEDVVRLFRVLRDPAQAAELQRVVELTPWSRAEFYACWDPAPGASDVELCRRLVVRSFQAVGSKRARSRNGWRARVDHITPVDSWRRWPDEIPRFVARLREVMIEQRPASDVIALYDSPDTAFFVDPPYLHETRAWGHRSIYDHELTAGEHAALLAQLQAVAGMVLLTGYRSPLYDSTLLPAGWLRVDVHARAQGNRPRVESMWINPAAQRGLRQPSLALVASA
ncbi:DNA adenine methylase [Luteimonas sp. M1R5S18]|uniref:DNA adenine methylase n=1 Tax=Luteimonas rhizosphaericola TaxID=3042024 RepID=A0ABT6JN82_9GAMM|nr:DNA adenine methylase [Luteimonas rhizosphaericola]MDH5832134.1 DNA adenine methylase [Luteimonas rhizosphaericola]